MPPGLSTVNWADKVLNHMLRQTASTTPPGQYVALHIGEPGSAGTANPAGTTTRVSVTFSASSGGSCSASTQPQWASWAGGSQTLTHITVWDAITAGNFQYSAALASSKAITNGDTFNLTSLTFALTPLAS